jgi:acyl carrier protein phosphodiesterase
MEQYSGSLPNKTNEILPVVTKYNWFMAYRSLEGLKSILFKMSQRTRFNSNMSLAIQNLEKNYSNIEFEFKIFFNELEYFVNTKKENFL